MKKWTSEINARFTQMWLEGCGVKVMAHEFGWPQSTISWYRAKLGLPRRRRRYKDRPKRDVNEKSLTIYLSNEEYQFVNVGSSRRGTSKSQYLRGLVRMDAAASASMEA